MTTKSRLPNFVLILGDYMGYGDIGPTGVRDIATRHLDRVADDGMLFTDATAAAPICSPSRAAILTGRYPARIGLEENVNFGRTDIAFLRTSLPWPASCAFEAFALASLGSGTWAQSIGSWIRGLSRLSRLVD